MFIHILRLALEKLGGNGKTEEKKKMPKRFSPQTNMPISVSERDEQVQCLNSLPQNVNDCLSELQSTKNLFVSDSAHEV